MALTEDHRNQLSVWLDSGWSVVGYSTEMLAMGNLNHLVLIQKGFELKSVSTVFDKGRHMASNVFAIAPAEAS